MADASFSQTSFLGGEWSAFIQGRTDLPKYKSGMNVCRNGYPVEEGAWARRPGFMFAAVTRYGNPARLIPFTFTQNAPYNMEFTDNHLRMFEGISLVSDSFGQVAQIDAENPAVVTLMTAIPGSWATGDSVLFAFASANNSTAGSVLRNRQFRITLIDTYHFSIQDEVTGANIDGSTIGWNDSLSIQANHILDFTTVWTGTEWADLRSVQTDTASYLCYGTTPPYTLAVTANPTANSVGTFSFGASVFVDGPYLDDLGIPVTYVSGAVTGPIVITSTSALFAATDVGRLVRMFQVPQSWDDTVNYSLGSIVTYLGTYYTVIGEVAGGGSGVNNSPANNPVIWGLTPTAAVWIPGTITTYTSPTQVTVTLAPLTDYTGAPVYLSASYNPVFNSFLLGVYSNTTYWPSCGTYFEGRVWLAGNNPAGAGGNRFDTSMSGSPNTSTLGNTTVTFSPTDVYGNVPDNSGISEILECEDNNTIFWMSPDGGGVVLGTQAGEWVVKASELGDPITPTSIQAHRVTKYGCANILPQRTGLSLVFVQRYARRVLELITDVFTQRFSAPNLSFTAKHLTASSVLELAHQEELAPIIWSRVGDGSLKGMTYRRTSSFATEEPVFSGWHRHDLGSGRSINSICVGPSVGGNLDSLAMVTYVPNANTNTAPYFVEVATDLFDEDSSIYDSFFVDAGVTPTGANTYTANGVTYVQYSGLWHLNGNTVSVFAGGLDLGDYPVTNGSVSVPLGSANVANGFFTQAYIANLNGAGYQYGVNLDESSTTIPPTSPTPATVQAYIGPTTNFSGQGPFLVPWWTGEKLFTITSLGIRAFNIFTGAELYEATAASLISGSPGLGASVSANPFAFDPTGGIIYCAVDGGDNCSRLVGIKAGTSSFTLASIFGTAGSAGEPTNGVNPPLAMAYLGVDTGYIGVVTVSGTHIAIYAVNAGGTGGLLGYAGYITNSSASFIAATNAFYALQSPSSPEAAISFYRTTVLTGANAYAAQYAPWDVLTTYGTGANVSYLGVAYTSAGSSNTGNNPASQPTDWTVIANPLINTIIMSIAATSVDPTWTHISATGGIVPDHTDGNFIASFTTGDSVTNKQYMCKIRAGDGAILWAIPITANADLTPASALSRILSGKMTSFDGSTVYLFNTVAGTATTYTVPGFIGTGGNQISDDGLGLNIGFDTFNQTAGSPAPINGTPTSFTDIAAAIQLGTIFQGSITTTQRFNLPTVIGFTFTSQGQILRPATAPEAGAQNGPPMAKTRRTHMFGALLQTAIQGTISFGTNFTSMYPANFTQPNTAPYTILEPFSGTYWNEVEDEYSFDSMLCWQITRPWPATVISTTSFLHTQDR